ncbi:uncharacterized protein PGTG_21858 [Puccinia graminis f. sp. tritici CRL 75-36-700-3]|uniref:Uncharacterized protein n=1 Tax=Puccinia graminis f. sp. tritici (strain CRL 75-36-700-3 / race SCCL) TaxID=418459 RepID=H6QSS3_PUCGT|nr:uncharacterized protein PGTG_21858 [Puccinia graminis f. sp. tritici CRL 75-36-700-3]EHS63814.1 hypothetical protein PGTG_21858 [Puccinia graminis f. sp. tritici CRL 75-36-700-3]
MASPLHSLPHVLDRSPAKCSPVKPSSPDPSSTKPLLRSGPNGRPRVPKERLMP